jgi:hypothetical protein
VLNKGCSALEARAIVDIGRQFQRLRPPRRGRSVVAPARRTCRRTRPRGALTRFRAGGPARPSKRSTASAGSKRPHGLAPVERMTARTGRIRPIAIEPTAGRARSTYGPNRPIARLAGDRAHADQRFVAAWCLGGRMQPARPAFHHRRRRAGCLGPLLVSARGTGSKDFFLGAEPQAATWSNSAAIF